MPLKSGSDSATFRSNVREMVRAGHPVRQSVAAAYAQKRKSQRSKRRSKRA